MKRSDERILTTHVGSIARPRAMLDLANMKVGPPQDPVQYARVVRESVADVVQKQVAAGIDIVNDGEYGKSSWANYILERISGFERRTAEAAPMDWLGRDRERFPEVIAEEFKGMGQVTSKYVCTGPIRYAPEAVRRDIDNLKAALAPARALEGFLTAVAPASGVFNGTNEFYASERDYIFALAEALRDEYMAIYESGLIVQVDDAVLANMYDFLSQKSPKHYREWAELRVAALNHALRDIPEDRIRYHVCFGSWHVPHTSDAPLEDIVDLILTVRAGAYSLEAANPRHEHEWRVWQKVKLPPGKILIPGVVTHHIITVEHPQVVADRIVKYANIVGRENVIAGTDCGFAQTELISRVHPSVMWAKFQSLAEGARLATKELWGRKS
ncbi:MAG TPA: cobalamin-independent methionine synthase II family protein [Steroidobacteraceae bacterium]|jgi:5-methyltetrahydropteroyltriglutamate--homocysteine methyltransferase|nr:cobalamin-independent methionine synthase II family protein [Steroidobacteraceae bacterium]